MFKIKNKINITFQKGDMVLVTAFRVSNKRKYICAKLLPSLERPYVVQNEFSTNSDMFRYPTSERIRYCNINDVYKLNLKKVDI